MFQKWQIVRPALVYQLDFNLLWTPEPYRKKIEIFNNGQGKTYTPCDRSNIETCLTPILYTTLSCQSNLWTNAKQYICLSIKTPLLLTFYSTIKWVEPSH